MTIINPQFCPEYLIINIIINIAEEWNNATIAKMKLIFLNLCIIVF